MLTPFHNEIILEHLKRSGTYPADRNENENENALREVSDFNGEFISEKGNYSLMGRPVDEYPDWTNIKEEKEFL